MYISIFPVLQVTVSVYFKVAELENKIAFGQSFLSIVMEYRK